MRFPIAGTMAVAFLTFSPAAAQFRRPDVVTPPPPIVGEPVPQPPAEPPETNNTAPPPPVTGPTSRAAEPQSNERQIADLQAAVSALQTEVEQLRAQLAAITPEPGDYYLSRLHPRPRVRCDSGGITSVQAILDRVHTHPSAEMSPRASQPPFELEPHLPYWTGCREIRR